MSVRLSPGGIFGGGYYFYHDEYKKYPIHEKLPTHILASGIGIGCEQLHRAGGDHVSGGGGGTGHHHRGGGDRRILRSVGFAAHLFCFLERR